jgi:uncharacterized protein with PIN domain
MLNRHGPKGVRKAATLIQEAGFQIESVTPHQAQLALEAYASYGKGPEFLRRYDNLNHARQQSRLMVDPKR